eukprot:1858616-Prymnesium_polylepis.1
MVASRRCCGSEQCISSDKDTGRSEKTKAVSATAFDTFANASLVTNVCPASGGPHPAMSRGAGVGWSMAGVGLARVFESARPRRASQLARSCRPSSPPPSGGTPKPPQIGRNSERSSLCTKHSMPPRYSHLPHSHLPARPAGAAADMRPRGSSNVSTETGARAPSTASFCGQRSLCANASRVRASCDCDSSACPAADGADADAASM